MHTHTHMRNTQQGKIRGFMHLDNGQEAIPALVADAIRKVIRSR